jgi:hypothetical protein
MRLEKKMALPLFAIGGLLPVLMTGFSALAQEPATSAESSSPAATATASSELTVSGETHWGQIEVVGPGANQEASMGFRPNNVVKGATGDWLIGANTGAGGPGTFTIEDGESPWLTIQSNGNITIPGNLTVNGTLAKGSGSFVIDHPLDPANKYLYHSFVESPDMMNVYNGNVVTDAAGDATIQLPQYFGALNRDFRYQLTVVGQFAQAIVASEVDHNSFSIKTDKPGVKVSWQVTGIRQDAFANAHRIKAEVDKPESERGHYMHPELFGASEELGIGHVRP